MGVVYKARQPQLDRIIALKILSHDLAQDPAFVERFNREAKTLARLSHPNIVAVFDFGTAGPFCYLLMEHVDGVNLRQAMRTGGFKPAEALALVQDVCAALQFAHEEGILHRDIKPENILIDSKGRVKIADFGIAKLVGGSHPHDVTLTIQGSVLGSPHYMAPEQIETPGDVDQRADIYSLGVVLYEMLTGELPIGRFALPSEKAAMDARIDDIVLRTLAKEREARFQTAQEVSTRVDALTQNPATVPPASAASPMESGMARFSLLSAILTAVSILFGIIVAYLFASIGDLEDVIRDIGAGWALFNLVATFGPAITGFILGASALGAIRKSGGTKDGLGFAIFAVVTWPIVFMAVLILASLMVPLRYSSGGSIGYSLAMLIVVIPLLLASFVMIRGLRRWARGVEKKDGQRDFPGLTGTVLAALGVVILGPVLAFVIASMVPASHPRPDFAEIRAGDEPSDERARCQRIEHRLASRRARITPAVHHQSSFRCGVSPGALRWQRQTPKIQRNRHVDSEEVEVGGIRRNPFENRQHGTLGGQPGQTRRDGGARGAGAIGELQADTDFAEWNFRHWENPVSGPPIGMTSESFTIATLEEMVGGEKRPLRQLKLEIRYFEQ